MTPRVLIVAGSDSGGGAGIQADVKTVTMLGGHAMTAITALTAQNTLGVQAVQAVPAAMVVAQMRSCGDDIGVDAVKIGMIGSAETAHAVADVLVSPAFAAVPVVFDPVMVATSGSVLADAETISAFDRLMALATVVTPNLPEARALGGRDAIRAHGCHVLLKGGHGEGAIVVDELIAPDGATRQWEGEKLATDHTHGTGCTLASAVASGLGAGLSLETAVERAIRFVRIALLHAPGFGRGNGPIGHTLGVVPFDVLEG
jgi:hydroxymethylpyrimidine/phosphomethylpyrimidine kinase